MNWILRISISLIFLSPLMEAQQNYSGNSALNCNSSIDVKNVSKSTLYTCKGQQLSCRAFLIFTSNSLYNTVPAIAALTSSDQAEIVRINNLTTFAGFQTRQEVIIPVNCSCSGGQYYEAITTYQVLSKFESYFTIANGTYQGLTTRDSLQLANNYSQYDLLPGHKLRVPLRCACPTRAQSGNGTEYLVTYSVGSGDTLYELSKRFNVSVARIREANTDELSVIYTFTTILIPLPNEPSSSHTVNRGYTLGSSPLPSPFVRKSRSKAILSTVGIAAGAFSLFILLLVLILFLFHKNRAEVQRSRGRNIVKVLSPQDLILEIASFDRGLKVFKFSEIKKATGNFRSKSRIKGSMYRGTFRRQVLAIKRNSGNAEDEVKMLHQINHFNIVKLHGFCLDKDDSYLVYEYMKNGSLHEWLNRRGSEGLMSWSVVIRIALDVANGLLYLHNFANPAYVHNNISSSNILLDGNLRAKISNFSLARTADCNSKTRLSVKSTEKTSPECLEAASITPQVDVFAFGVVLLQLLMGKYLVSEKDGRQIMLTRTLSGIMESKNAETELSQLILPGLCENAGIEYAIQVVKLSLSCLRQDPADRPEMVEVVSVLLKVQLNIQKPLFGISYKQALSMENYINSFSSSSVFE